MNIEQNIEHLEKKIQKNANKIEDNANRIQQNTGALEILKTFKADTNKFFTMWIMTFFALLIMIGYTIYLLNDTGVIDEKTIDIEDVETIDNSHIKIGDDVWEKSK